LTARACDIGIKCDTIKATLTRNHISTSYVERQNPAVQMHMRRLRA
jgi:hypothetical protein